MKEKGHVQIHRTGGQLSAWLRVTREGPGSYTVLGHVDLPQNATHTIQSWSPSWTFGRWQDFTWKIYFLFSDFPKEWADCCWVQSEARFPLYSVLQNSPVQNSTRVLCPEGRNMEVNQQRWGAVQDTIWLFCILAFISFKMQNNPKKGEIIENNKEKWGGESLDSNSRRIFNVQVLGNRAHIHHESLHSWVLSTK